ncbi:heterokaryon incompatibility protein-domain-containing protein [Hypoxylon sp. NC1633]|nr:heterokaryon incompatibility protein-domain-containing protein [Hypoxylon sp. NC1633]
MSIADADIAILKSAKLPRRSKPTGEKRIILGYRDPSPRRNKQATRDRLRNAIWKAKRALYKYDCITKDQVRLMALEPSQDHDADLKAKLVTIPISDLPRYEYEALSYHWGESTADNPIFINSKHSQTARNMNNIGDIAAVIALRIYVMDNLYEALRHMRDKEHTILLWADGICMDQGSELEKGAQVSNMAAIYSSATRVGIWLGLADRDRRTDRAMDFIGQVVAAYDIDPLIQPSQADNWSDLIFLMRSSWFSRRWVIQELALAKGATVRCGTKDVDWRDFSDAISLFDLNFQEIRKLFADRSKDYNAITELRPLGAKILVDELSNIFLKAADQSLFEPVKTLETLVSTLASFETTDPRDTIYAFLNIAKDSSPKSALKISTTTMDIPPPTPQYRHDLLMVYTDFFRYVVASSQSLDILCRQWALPERKTKALMYERLVELPSWIKTVPESPYGKQGEGLNGRKNGDSFVGTPNAKFYNASRGKSPEIRFGMEPSVPTELPTSPVTNGGLAPIDLTVKTTRRKDSTASIMTQGSQPLSPVVSHFSDESATWTARRPPSIRIGSRPVTPAEERQMLSERDPSIYVRGFVLGTVSWKTDPIADGIIPQRALQRLGWPYDEDEYFAVPDKVWRTLVADRGPDGRPPPSWYHRACLRCLVHDTPNGHIATKGILEQHPSGIMYDYIKRVQAVTWNRVVLEGADETNRQGEALVGIGPPSTEKDDLICIIFGCSVPCIIRPWMSIPSQDTKRRKPGAGEEPDYYEFIGEAFIYGKMDGQAIDGISSNDLHDKTREFRLR